jgi:hypothetical protein
MTRLHALAINGPATFLIGDDGGGGTGGNGPVEALRPQQIFSLRLPPARELDVRRTAPRQMLQLNRCANVRPTSPCHTARLTERPVIAFDGLGSKLHFRQRFSIGDAQAARCTVNVIGSSVTGCCDGKSRTFVFVMLCRCQIILQVTNRFRFSLSRRCHAACMSHNAQERT